MKCSILVLCILIGVCHAFLKQLKNLVPDSLNPLNMIFTNRCIEDLGCFYTGPPFFHPLNRPISLPPTSSPKMQYLLFTPANPTKAFHLEATEESLMNSTFDAKEETKFLIHGFLADVDLEDIRHQMKTVLLEIGNFNVIVVDWTGHNGPPYAQAVANCRVIGASVAKLINFLIDNTGIKPQSIHVIGHSLGGQMAGYIGERVPNLGRITGLDPAGPYFQGCDPEVRLDQEDALFVDVIHTDGAENVLGGLGINDPIGHIDFYPNGGRLQFGCVYSSSSNSPFGSVVNFTTQFVSNFCDHSRANDYFFESIGSTDCRFLAVQCNSYNDFEQGKCSPENSTVMEMGFYAQKLPDMPTPAKFFLRTNGSYPFCIEDSIRL